MNIGLVCQHLQVMTFGIGKDAGFRAYPKALRTHYIRLLGPKAILYKAFGAI